MIELYTPLIKIIPILTLDVDYLQLSLFNKC